MKNMTAGRNCHIFPPPGSSKTAASLSVPLDLLRGKPPCTREGGDTPQPGENLWTKRSNNHPYMGSRY